MGGVTYVELLVKALSLLPHKERPKIFLIIANPESIELHRHIFPLVDGFIVLGLHPAHISHILQLPFQHCRSFSDLAHSIDFYYPVNSDVRSEICSASWIPDFQHIHLPNFFSKQELALRDGWFQKIASHAKIVVFSSHDSENDFRRLYPESSAVVRVLHFHALPQDEWYDIDPVQIQKKYNLPENFLLCSNQFWAHKNHGILFEALAQLHRSGKPIDLVCTGATVDYRFPTYFPGIKQKLIDLNIEARVHILGTLPRNDQIQLMRRSLAVIQPSLFEGWSTVVEDARALGKTMFLSDLAVHREQAPDHAIFFERKDSGDLAQKISRLLPDLNPGPDPSREHDARIKAREFVLHYAGQFCSIAAEARQLFGNNPHSGGQPKKVTIATSIAPKNTERQRQAVQSWMKLGFSVVSLNCAEEIPALSQQFPEVTFVTIGRDARGEVGKPLIYFDSFLEYFRNSGNDICGIVNSDIMLRADRDFIPFIEREARNAMVTGCRVDIPNSETMMGSIYAFGFDYFFFDRSVIDLYPESTLTIGSPWWDYWALLIPLSKGFPVKHIIPTVGYHIKHDTQWKQSIWYEFAKFINDYITKHNLEITFDKNVSGSDKNLLLVHAVADYLLMNSQYITYKTPGSYLDRKPLDTVKFSSFMKSNLPLNIKLMAKTYWLYLQKCLELCPYEINTYLTLIPWLFECKREEEAKKLLCSIESIRMKQTPKH
ncbi:MAG: glycosyltransferase family 4 protein [Nitrospirota bacterium]